MMCEVVRSLIEFFRRKFENASLKTEFQSVPVGAATFNPNTIRFVKSVLRGDDHLVYLFVQRCLRPWDFENIYRMRQHTQFQVLLGKAVDIYSVLIEYFSTFPNFKMSDLAIYESSWKSTSLGAFGRGWEAQINGIEVCQITYFSKFAGEDINAIVLEFAFGIERIKMALINFRHQFNSSVLLSCVSRAEMQVRLDNIAKCIERSSDLNLSVLERYDEFCLANQIFNELDGLRCVGIYAKNAILLYLKKAFTNIFRDFN